MLDAQNNNRMVTGDKTNFLEMSGTLEESWSFFPELITKRRNDKRCLGFDEVFASSGYNGEIGWFSLNRGRLLSRVVKSFAF
ncbi:hypothetical protein V6N13_029146 [Hibiscus sabdariffa]|uniref:Uncharacterized protein n=1 Tax=Hibiscus sabdariffa TaxID=183260 RepID=A0ABR2ARS2_9ROSI